MTDPCPKKCARFLCDRRVIKMCLETAQMLSTALAYHFIDVGYKPTHPKHPCNVWARKSRQNFMWLVEHGIELCFEYHNRYGKLHKSLSVILRAAQDYHVFPDKGFTEPANCAANKKLSIDFKHIDDVYEAYRQYLYARFENDKKPATCKIGD